MVFYIFTAVVFMAEFVLAFALIMYLLKLSRIFTEYSLIISELNPKIKEIMQLCTKISEQMLEFAPIVVRTVKDIIRNIIAAQVKNLVSVLTFWTVKREVERQLSK